MKTNKRKLLIYLLTAVNIAAAGGAFWLAEADRQQVIFHGTPTPIPEE